MPPLYTDHTVSEQKNAVNADTLPLQIKKTHHARVTLRQYRSIELSAAEPRIVLSCRHANLKMMFGGKKSVLPKTTSSVALIATEYNFKNTVRFVKKQNRPAARKSADCASGFQSKDSAPTFAVPIFVPRICASFFRTSSFRSASFRPFRFADLFSFPSALRARPVALKKNAKASATMHSDKILTGSFNTTRKVKTRTGYSAATA